MKNFDCKQCKVSADRSIFLTNLFKKLTRKGESRTAAARVVSRRLMSARFPTQGSTWDHWVTFTLADGRKVELLTEENTFHIMKEGTCGILTHQGETLIRFDIP